jgi:prophage antirepressor-like protein
MLTVNEPGLYRLIFQSRKPEAEALKMWVFHEVLPTLRRTGMYTMPQAQHTLTPQGQLPPPAPRIKEHAEVSWHMARLWTLLRHTDEWLSNRELAHRSGIKERTARAHTRYFRQLGLVEVHEYFPNHLHRMAEDAEARNPAVYHRLNMIATLIEERRRP